MEKCSDIFLHGSRWVRADFHLHTKADREFVFSDDENYYYSSYVTALQQANIEIGVVTNHNKFDFEEFKALKKTARGENIFLLPGVELFRLSWKWTMKLFSLRGYSELRYLPLS